MIRRANGPAPIHPASLYWAALLLLATIADISSAAEDEAQRRSAIPLGISSDITAGEVQDRLQLSDAQRRQIREFSKQKQEEEKELTTTPNGPRRLAWAESKNLRQSFVKRVESVLTPEQTVQWSRLRRLDTVALFGPYRRIEREVARDELKLRDEQLKAISDLQQEYCRECQRLAANYDDLEAPAGTGFFFSPFFIETNKAANDFDSRFDSLMKKILDKKQSERWSQLEWQKAADEQGVAVLLDASIIGYLNLDEGQQTEIKKLAAETDAELAALRTAKKYADEGRARAASVKKGVAVLGPDQKQLWQALLGQPFRTPLKQAIYGDRPQP